MTKYLSLFSGIGGFELGIQQAAKKLKVEQPICIGYSEIFKPTIRIYEKHFPTHLNLGDITKIDATTLPDFDFLCGGFPCQSFSFAGNRRGFDDTRGTLFFDIARILGTKKPKIFLLENVKGLVHHDSGRTFSTVIQTLDDLGYDLQWQVLNSQHFHVPQNRQRVYIVGHLRGTPRPQVFPIIPTGGQIIAQEQDGVCASTLTAAGAGGTTVVNKTGINTIKVLNGTKQGFDIATDGDGINLGFPGSETRRGRVGHGYAQTLEASGPQGVLDTIAIPIITPDRLEKRQNGRRFKENGDPAFTVVVAEQRGVLENKSVNHMVRIRVLTPLECEKLQGFPAFWTKFGMYKQKEQIWNGKVKINKVGQKAPCMIPAPEDGQYKMIDSVRYNVLGNAVTVSVISAIMQKLL